jgi:disulfide bond formation protein DsbB
MIDRFLQLTLSERALAVSFVVSASLLAGAHLFEHLGGYVPCILCLDQREAHWAALGVAFAGFVAARILNSRLGATAAVGAAALVYAVSAGLAFYHTGVEYKFWPGPAICSGSGGEIADISSLTAALGHKADAPSCADAQWRMFGISMAGYNLLASAGLFALTLAAALAETRRVREIRGVAPIRAKKT